MYFLFFLGIAVALLEKIRDILETQSRSEVFHQNQSGSKSSSTLWLTAAPPCYPSSIYNLLHDRQRLRCYTLPEGLHDMQRVNSPSAWHIYDIYVGVEFFTKFGENSPLTSHYQQIWSCLFLG